MSEEITETTEQTDEEKNFAELRKQKEELESQVQELSAFKVNETVRQVGLDPNTGNGAALKELLGSDASEEKAQELVAKFGWQADEPESEKHEPTPNERAAQEFADRTSELSQVTTSDEPPDLNSQIAEAEAEGDWGKSMALKLAQFNQMVAKQ